MDSAWHREKNSMRTSALLYLEFKTFLDANKGEDVVMGDLDLDNYHVDPNPQTVAQITKQIQRIQNANSESEMYLPICIAFTLASLAVTSDLDSPVLLFTNTSTLPMTESDGAVHKPDVVGSFGTRDKASDISRNTFLGLGRPSTYDIVVPGEVKPTGESAVMQCQRYMFAASRHRPAACTQYGIVLNKKSFGLLAVGLEQQRSWAEVDWESDSCIKKLYYCVDLIRNEFRAELCPAAPQLDNVAKGGRLTFGRFFATVGGEKWNLLPIWLGRGNGRKPFVALAEDSSQHVRVLKYAWYGPTQHRRERKFLEDLRGTPGIVEIDTDLSRDTIREDEQSGRKYSLLAMKTVGHPLCSCTSVLEFLEAMYDLLEVLRYCVQEKKVLHRDISWSNVLIRPMHGSGVEKVFRAEPTNEPIPHHYRFLSDIFKEDQKSVRVALADFDVAADLDNDSPDNLKGATGTPMFMANDVLSAADGDDMNPFKPAAARKLKASVLGEFDMKYSNPEEKRKWDEFYSQLDKITFINDEDPEKSFKQGPVHDAESVFYLCLLFFNRMWPKFKSISTAEGKLMERTRGNAFAKLASKKVGDDDTRAFDRKLPSGGFFEPYVHMLNTIRRYLRIPWYNVKNTGRGERYEFHLHDFMQRIILREIWKLQKERNVMEILTYPIRVRTSGQYGQPYTTCSIGLVVNTTTSAKRANDESNTENVEGVGDAENYVFPTLNFSDPPDGIAAELWTIFQLKKAERVWLFSDNIE